ncbi:MAG: glycosyltransferase family 9 protein [Bacteroidota bacterium]
MSERDSDLTSIKRILLVRTDRLGDVILTLPMLPVIRKCFPNAYLAMLLRRYTGEIIEGNPYVDELLWYDNGTELTPFDDMSRTIRSKQFDAAIVVYPTLRLAWLMFRAGIPLRVGTGYRYYSILFNRRVYEHRKDAQRHELEYNLNLLKTFDCAATEKPEFFIDIKSSTQARVESILTEAGVNLSREIVIIHPGSGGSAREWSPENFGKLAAMLAREQHAQVFVTGTVAESAQIGRVVEASGGAARSLAGKFSLKELAALARMAHLFIANSTGPIHLAAAVGVPVIGLYPQHTPMSARRWGPYTDKKIVFTPDKPITCAECTGTKGEPCACMESITVEEVHNAAIGLLKDGQLAGKGLD